MASVISSWLPRKRPTSDPSWEWGRGAGTMFTQIGTPWKLVCQARFWDDQCSQLAELQRIQRIRENYTFYLGHLVAATAVHGCARHEIGFFDLGLGSVKARSRRGGSPRLSSRGIGEWPLARPITNDIKHTAAEALRSNFSPKFVIIEKFRQTMFESTL